MRRSFVLAAICTLLLACSLGPLGTTVPNGPGSGILFVGNSLTYWNDLPLIVQALFDAAGGKSYEVGMVAAPDVSLEDHWNDGAARQHIERGGWEYVVLQQGPSSLPESRVLLREYVNRFAGPIQTIGARPALYSVWPSRGRQGDFARAIESYTIAANDVNALLFPVATAWLAAWRRDSSMVLYELDGLHPSVLGSYVAALVMYGVISGKTPIGLASQLRLRDGRLVNVPAALATTLQQAADEAIRGSQ